MPEFDTLLQAEGPGCFAVVPDEVMDELGGRRLPVRVTVQGYTYRSTTAVYGGRAMVVLNRKVREAAGVGVGDRVRVHIERDDEPREVRVPEALAEALSNDAGARESFDSMSYTHRKEYAEWITEAKRPETRERRVAKAIQMLRKRQPLR